MKSFLIATLITILPFPALAGSLVKASTDAVYYVQYGTRYAFPSEKTYFTWYTDFSQVQTITDAELASYPLGGNITYRPGTRMLKMVSDPKVYAVDGKNLRPIASESVAREIFGVDWARQVDDLPEPFFTNYTVGASVTAASDYIPAALLASYTDIGSFTPPSAILGAQDTAPEPASIISAPTPTPNTTTEEANALLTRIEELEDKVDELTKPTPTEEELVRQSKQVRGYIEYPKGTNGVGLSLDSNDMRAFGVTKQRPITLSEIFYRLDYQPTADVKFGIKGDYSSYGGMLHEGEGTILLNQPWAFCPYSEGMNTDQICVWLPFILEDMENEELVRRVQYFHITGAKITDGTEYQDLSVNLSVR